MTIVIAEIEIYIYYKSYLLWMKNLRMYNRQGVATTDLPWFSSCEDDENAQMLVYILIFKSLFTFWKV